MKSLIETLTDIADKYDTPISLVTEFAQAVVESDEQAMKDEPEDSADMYRTKRLFKQKLVERL